MNTMRLTAAFILICFTFSSCATDISANTYSDLQVGESNETHIATVIHKREVKVGGADNLNGNASGTTGGALAGAAAGSSIGRGQGQGIGTLAGLLVGAVAGAIAEKKLKEQKGIEYTLKLEDGSLKSIVQGPDLDISLGQKVLLIQSFKGQGQNQSMGRSRIVPFNA